MTTEQMSSPSAEPATSLVDVRDVRVQFRARVQQGDKRLLIKAVDGVDLRIARGETLGLVGESGCGKSTLGRAMIGLRELAGGSVVFDGHTISSGSSRQMRSLRRRMQIVFQDPTGSLNPRMTVGATIAEPIRAFGLRSGREVETRVAELLAQVGLDAGMAHRYPHEFSGGQCQRVAIARALAAEPEFIVCDEPISALDVSIQAQILNLLVGLRDELSLTLLFISHDLAVVRRISARIAVMYLGNIVEIGDRQSLYAQPAHPYTSALLSSVPVPDPTIERARNRVLLKGDLPSPENPPAGCVFHTRCWKFQALDQPDVCRTTRPALTGVGDGQAAACHFPLTADTARSGINPR
ncbi:ABC transporter ATP-binding protein [Micromonospora sp. NBC_01412]|uniref:ABC transporter ATP-binding protein n=1 Tax=Micromonospora sp. NBC_01412 TaxID=2903590 RepID=UPI003248A100